MSKCPFTRFCVFGAAALGGAALLALEAKARSTRVAKIAIDTLITAKHVVTMSDAAAATVLDNHAVAVRNGVIVDVLPRARAEALYCATEHVDLPNSVVMPGMINMHTHMGMTMMRGYADDVGLAEWLTQHIWPGEGKFASPEWVRDGATLAMAEMIRGGVTCANDMYFFNEALCEVAARVGFRVRVGMCVLEFPTTYAANADEYLAKAEALVAAHSGANANDLIQFAIAPHAPYTVSDANLQRCKVFADEHALPLHIHLHETCDEVVNSVSGAPSMATHMSAQRTRPFANLDRLGLVDSRLIAAHMTHLNADEVARCGEARAAIAHCPSSNLKLASGLCPVAALTRAGATVCLGTDSCASNNTLDMFGEMRLAALVAKGAASSDATAVPALDALRMATVNGARALGIESQCGSLECGKAADVIAIDLDALHYTPMYDVLSHLVYVADRHRVTDVWIAGRRVMKERALTTIDEAAIKATALRWQTKMAQFRDEQRAARAAAQ